MTWLLLMGRLADESLACLVSQKRPSETERFFCRVSCKRKKAFGLMPSYRGPFRAAYCIDPICNFDGQCILRNRPEDVDGFPGFALEEVSYVIANCLVGDAGDSGGRQRFGAFLPSESEAVIHDVELQGWLDGATLGQDMQPVTLVALGSQSTLSAVCEQAEARLLEGCLRSSPRVLAVSKSLQESMSQDLKDEVSCGRLRVTSFLQQWAVLNHHSVRCFVWTCSYQQHLRIISVVKRSNAQIISCGTFVNFSCRGPMAVQIRRMRRWHLVSRLSHCHFLTTSPLAAQLPKD